MTCLACIHKLRAREVTHLKGRLCRRHEHTRHVRQVRFWKEVVRHLEGYFKASASGGDKFDHGLYAKAKANLERLEKEQL